MRLEGGINMAQGITTTKYESFNKDDVTDYVSKTKPDFWKFYTRTEPKTLDTIYGVECHKVPKITETV